MDPIELTFKSAADPIPGLEAALGRLGDMEGRLKAIDGLLASMGTRTLNIQLKGGDNLHAMATSLHEVIALMRQAGEGGLAAKIGNGLNVGDASESLKLRLVALRAEHKITQQYLEDNKLKLGLFAKSDDHRATNASGQLDHAAWREKFKQAAAVVSQQATLARTQKEQISYISQAVGGLDVLKGIHAQTEAVGATTTAEAKLQHQAHDTTAAMAAQMEVAQRKAKMMNDLATAVARVTTEENANTGATKANNAANAGGANPGAGRTLPFGTKGGAIATAQVWQPNKDTGALELVDERRTFREASGREQTVDGEGNVVRRQNSLKAQREMLAARLAEYRQGKRGATDLQRSVLDTGLANDLRMMHGQLPAGLVGSTFASGLLGKAGGYEESGHESFLKATAMSPMDQLLQKAMHGSNLRDAQAAEQAALAQAEAAATTAHNAQVAQRFGYFTGQKGAQFGKSRTSTEEDGGRTRRTETKVPIGGVFSREFESVTHVERFDAAGKQLRSTMDEANNSLSRTGRGVTDVGANFLHNVASVTMWTAAVGTLYAALAALKHGFAGAIHTDREMAFMGSIFRGAPGEYKGLTSDVLRIGAEQGRTSEEAMAAAVKFAHLGLTRGETGQFTSLAMKAANIMGPQTNGEEAAHAVASYTEAFGMDIGQATVALDQLNSIANHSNTTVKELMETMGRTGAVAKATGFEFSQYASLLAGGAGNTGLPVTQMAQAMGMLLTNAAEPQRQRELKMRFGVDTFHESGVAKTGPQLLEALHERYQQMSPEAGQSMLTLLGGARNAQRTGAMMNTYDESITRSVVAQRDLNSASELNNKILDTTQAKLATLSSAWTNMWHSAYQGGGKQAVNAALGGTASLMEKFGAGAGFLLSAADDVVFNSGGPDPATGRYRTPGAEYMQGQRTDAYFKKQGKGIADAKADLARRDSVANSDYTALAQFQGYAKHGRLAQMQPEEVRRVIGQLAISFGGGDADIAKNREEWQGAYDKDGAGRLEEVFGAKSEELRPRAAASQQAAKKRSDKIEEYLNQQIGILEKGLYKMEPHKRRNHGDLSVTYAPELAASPERVAQVRAELAELRKTKDEFGKERKSVPDVGDVSPNDSKATTNMREEVRYTLAAQDYFSQNARFSSPYESDKIAWERQHIAMREDEARKRRQQAQALETGPQSAEKRQQAQALKFEAGTITGEDAQREAALKFRDPISGLLDARYDAGQQVHRSMGAFGVGLSPTRQMADSLSGARELAAHMQAMPAGQEREGTAAALLTEAYKLQNDVLTRKQTILHDIRQTQEQMAKDAGRALLMAGPGEQLMAAGLQASFERNGRMDAATFSTLDPATKQAMMQFNPAMAPQMVNHLGDLEREKADIDKNGGGTTREIEALIAALRDEQRKGTVFPAVLTGSSVPVTIVGGSATASAATIPQAMEGLPYKTPVGSFAEPDLEVGNTRNFRGSPMQGKENFGWQHKLEPWEGDGSSRKTDGYNWRPWRPDIPQYFGEPWKDDGRRPDIPQPLEAVEADPDSPYFGERWKDDGRRPDLRYFGEPWEGDPWKDDGRRPDIPQYFGEPWKDDGRRPDIPQYLEEAKRKLLPQNPDPLPVTTPYGDSTNLLIAKHRTTQLEAVLGQKRAIGPGLSDDQVAKFEKNNPVSNLKPSELPGFADTFSEVGKLMGSLYGRDASGFGQPEIGAYGARGQAYNIDGEYNLKTNRLSLSRDVMERFSKGDANAKNTVRHELAHYFQDMMAGDVDGIRALKGSGIEEANRKLRGMGLEPDKGQSSELQKGTLSEAPEAMAEMVAKYFEGPSRLDQASAPGFGGVTNHFNFGDDMKAFVAGMTDMAKTGLAAEFAQMRGDFAGLLAVLALHQGGGADVIVNAQ